jgi:hypothetical protein
MSVTAVVENDTVKLPVHVPNATSVEVLLPGEPAAAAGVPKGSRLEALRSCPGDLSKLVRRSDEMPCENRL